MGTWCHSECLSMNGSERTIPHSKVSEGAAPAAEEIPRERGGARPGAAVHQWKVGDGSDPEEKERAARSMTEKRIIKNVEIEYMPIF